MSAAGGEEQIMAEAPGAAMPSAQGGTAPPARSALLRDWLVVALAAISGAVDVTTFLLLGRVFSSVVTGNFVLLGLAAATGDGQDALHAGLAIAGYAAGVLAGAPIAARPHSRRTWPVPVTRTLGAELCVLLAFTVVWETSQRTGGSQLALLILLAVSLGLQTAAVRRLGQMSSTYLTSTFAGVLTGLVVGGTAEARWRGVGVIAALLLGAAAGALIDRSGPAWLPLLVLVPLAGVIATAAAVRD
jgi:uncharacterized membrane protein YoaK (UPF0700 family)